MNLTKLQQEQLTENKKKILDLIYEAERIISHDIKGVLFISTDSLVSAGRPVKISIVFDLEQL